jgi:hypothetical protein
MTGFRETLKDAVKKMAVKTSLDNLKKRGVKEVNVLGVDRIIGLIDEAVHRSLKSRLFGVEREAVTEATKAEFLRMLKSNEDLQRSKSEIEKLKDRAEEEVDQLRRELESQRQALAQRLQQGALEQRRQNDGDSEAVKLVARVNEMFAALGGGSGDLAQVQERVVELVSELVGHERRAAQEAKSALHDREVDTLQRRIKKMSETLEVTERRLQEVAAMKDIDPGISSIYRDVQGLASSESQYARKRELMSQIFKANLELQKGE